ncbi:hypothetical protein BDZ94DRAFT_1289818 [Collybia nuda]|uniref:Uncharacterized protein n=1 Tax=Collybia nuda TaxID=64659 RepID=A0A9P5Y8R2_9AGAR|nr:hypothetical protein BDZ94DRAFT_1289818 [Collybia nuda]
MAPSFAEIKAKATKVKDASVTKIQNTRDRNTSVPLAKTNWDPYSGTPAPAPPPPRVNTNNRPVAKTFPPPPPAFNRPAATPSHSPPIRSSPTPARSSPPTLPTRSPLQTPPLPSRSPIPPSRAPPPQGPPPIIRSTRPDFSNTPSQGVSNDAQEIDWTNLSPEDKEVFFSWLDEFFGNYLSITISPKRI